MAQPSLSPRAKAKRFGLIIFLLASALLLVLYAAGFFGKRGVTAQEFVNLQQGASAHAGYRRAHAKGICVKGVVNSNGQLAQYSKASVFAKGNTPFVGRFSIAGNNPHGHDLKAPVRSFALQLFLETGEQWRIAMNTPPVMAVATPEAFYKQLQALAPNPETGKRDPAKIKAFFKAHPESQAFLDWKKHYKESNSFALERYHSINAFYLVNAKGKKQAVRWTTVPMVNENAPTLNAQNPDALQQELIKRLSTSPVRFDWQFTLANAEDDENNPTKPWPETRTNISAGNIVIKSWQPQEGGTCDGVNFDPLVLPKGIAATADPILRARSGAYAQSYKRRAIEKLQQQLNAGANHEL